MPSRTALLDTAEPAIDDALRQFKAGVFQALGHPTRIHIVETLRQQERSVGVIQGMVGVEAANLSQHLAVLRSKRLVLTRKEGNMIYYRLRDPLLSEVLNIMRRYFHSHLEESLAMLKEVESEK